MNSIRTDKKIDFDDMILKAIDELEQTEEFNCKYIIVDEFQDISYSREKFLQKLIQKGKSQLFAVGDDWQAIYRFAGCDLNIFLNFDSKEHFGRSIISYITTTYRNSQELQNIVGPFIKANPEQYAKTIMSKAPNLDNPVKIMYHTGSRDNKIISLNHVLKQIYEINKYAKILILGRNNHDIDDYLFNKEKFVVSYYGESKIKKIKSLDFKSLEIEFCTVHGSKGLEEEYVIVLNADDSRLGFPNKTEDDELLKLVLSDKSSYKYAEERRLWYVALTRTKNYVYLMVNYNRPSVFVQEILKKCDIINPEIYNESSNIINCPHCKTGKLVTRKVKDSESEFFGCSNYPYCRYVNKNLGIVKSNGKRCPKCNDFMILKNGIYKCSNLRCKHEVFEHTVNFIDDNDLPF